MTARFTKEQLLEWAERLIEETHSEIAISRTDAHAESYRAQLELLGVAVEMLTADMKLDLAAPHYDTIALNVARDIMHDVDRRTDFLGGNIQLLSRIQCRVDAAIRAAIPPATSTESGQIRNLVMMVRLLARTVRKYNPGSQQVKDFTAYLQREGLISATDCLRIGDEDPE